MQLDGVSAFQQGGGSLMPRLNRMKSAGLLVATTVAGALCIAAQVAPAADSTGVAPREQPALRLPAAIVYERVVKPDSAVVFRHETHVAFENNRCTGCHPTPFRLLSPTKRIAHSEMESGGSCGTCHDGKKAFGVTEPAACPVCHAGRPSPQLAGSPAAAGAQSATVRKGPGPHAYPAGEDSPGKVTFRHETHMKGGASCAACHPKPYGMKFKTPAPGGSMHEATSCGACHDGKKAFATDNVDACERCHKPGGGS